MSVVNLPRLWSCSTRREVKVKWRCLLTLSQVCKQSRLKSAGVRFGPEVCQIGPKWDKSGTFSDQIQYILAPWSLAAVLLVFIFIRDVSFGSKVGHIGKNATNSGTFKDHISLQIQSVLKSDLKNAPIWGQSKPLWAQIWQLWFNC